MILFLEFGVLLLSLELISKNSSSATIWSSLILTPITAYSCSIFSFLSDEVSDIRSFINSFGCLYQSTLPMFLFPWLTLIYCILTISSIDSAISANSSVMGTISGFLLSSLVDIVLLSIFISDPFSSRLAAYLCPKT